MVPYLIFHRSKIREKRLPMLQRSRSLAAQPQNDEAICRRLCAARDGASWGGIL